jgi:hypothetical protein
MKQAASVVEPQARPQIRHEYHAHGCCGPTLLTDSGVPAALVWALPGHTSCNTC